MLTSSLLFSISFVLLTVHSAGSSLTIASQFSQEKVDLQKGLLQFAHQLVDAGALERLADHRGFYPAELMVTVPEDHRGSGR